MEGRRHWDTKKAKGGTCRVAQDTMSCNHSMEPHCSFVVEKSSGFANRLPQSSSSKTTSSLLGGPQVLHCRSVFASDEVSR